MRPREEIRLLQVPGGEPREKLRRVMHELAFYIPEDAAEFEIREVLGPSGKEFLLVVSFAVEDLSPRELRTVRGLTRKAEWLARDFGVVYLKKEKTRRNPTP